MTQRVGRVCGAALVAFCARAGLAFGGQDLKIDTRGDGVWLRTANGQVLHEAAGKITAADLVRVPGSSSRIATWTVVGPGGTPTHWFARSDDGQTFGPPAPTNPDLCLKAGRFDPLAGVPAVPEALRSASDNELCIVQFVAPPTDLSRDALQAAGARWLAVLVHNAFVVRASQAAAASLSARPDVRWVGPYHPAYKLDASLAGLTGADLVAVNLQLATGAPAERESVRAAAESLGGKFQSLSATGPLVRVLIPADRIPALLRHNDILFADRWIDEVPGTSSDMSLVRQVSGANFIETTLGYNGQGVRGELVDDSLRETHVDFQAQPILFHGPRSGFTDHGTGSFGIVFGTGVGNATARGLLPGAQQGIFGDKDLLTDRYAFTMESVSPAGPYRAVFQGNPWGSPWTTTYTTVSSEMDRIAFDSDLVMAQSMSNNGNQLARPEAWAKNIIACGGVLHNDTATFADDGWFGNSSIGPASDGRIKPDLSHFADSVLTTWDANDTDYANFLGTSSATMITAGYVGLLMQMWHEQVFAGFGGKADVFTSRPKAATARALLIHSAYQYPFASTTADMTRTHQGWGIADLQNLYNLRTSMLIVNETKPLAAGGMARYRFDVAGGAAFRSTLVFKDPPGNPAASVARINDLTLRVTAPDNTIYWGNVGLDSGTASVAGGVADTINPIECVILPSAAAGAWTVDVLATEVNQDGHPATGGVDAVFSLVVSGGTFRPCIADWNADGSINPADVALFINDWLASIALGNLVADIDQNLIITPADVGAFINAWSGALANGC